MGTIPAELAERLDFIGIDEASRQRLRSAAPLIDKHLRSALHLFYNKLAGVPAVASFFSGQPQMQRAENAQAGHWQRIAAAEFDTDYLDAAHRIGLRHARIGLEPRWYIGGYGVIVETLVRGVIADFMSEHLPEKPGMFGRAARLERQAALAASNELAGLVTDLVKAVLVDVDIAVTTYFDKLTAEAADQANVNAEKISSAVTGTGEVLQRLAAGDLTQRMETPFDDSFEKLRHDTNAVADRLTEIVTQLRTASTGVKTAAGEILAGANDLSERTTRQAAAIEETSASMEQLSGTVRENAARAAAAGTKSRDVTKEAEGSGAAMRDATTAMQQISTSSAKISSIIGIIDDIAFQTNLLALNASVEAARAGEAGKGFAVVAVEVRRLAQSAAEASAEVKALIEKSGQEVAAGSRLVGAAADRLNAMLAAVRENAELMAGIEAASEGQAAAIGEMSSAIRQMDEMTQHNAALVEETNAAIEQTEAQAVELDRIVDLFTLADTLRRPETRAARLRAVG